MLALLIRLLLTEHRLGSLVAFPRPGGACAPVTQAGTRGLGESGREPVTNANAGCAS